MSDSFSRKSLHNPFPTNSPSSYTVGMPDPQTFKYASRHRGSFSTGSFRDARKNLLESPNPLLHNRQSASPEPGPSRKCDNCEAEKPQVWSCSHCGMDFCDSCWVVQAQHKEGRTGPDGFPHEKADPAIVKRLKDILVPPKDHSPQILHIEDEDTTWFGLGRNNQNFTVFQDYGRYAAIMTDSSSDEHKHRYPQLVSFIGQTGAGKSTLINMLIDQQERKHCPSDYTFPSPVPGTAANGNVPTSGDVHLYSDPKTYTAELPMLYADCEGLEGGENLPLAAQYRNSAPALSKERAREEHATKLHKKRRMVSKGFHCTQRVIKWANTPDTAKRQYAVTELYPRLLYTFSDVVVFVLRNAKTFESTVLSLLISWASSSLEKSLNQPTLPHAVIALNATDPKTDPHEWDPDYATNVLMFNVADAVNHDPRYSRLRSYWVQKGRQVNTMKDLLECYYSSITVVRIPNNEGRYMMIDEQVNKLHNVIERRCSQSYNAKLGSRMTLNAETLNVYLQCAFDHFAQNLHEPFDFMDVSFRMNPIPLNFGGNILKLAVAMRTRYTDPRNIFKHLSLMVASCILLDCVRQSFQGNMAERILKERYWNHCDQALDDFCNIFWPCTFSNKRGDRCVNVKERHVKGHQNDRGTVIGSGPYEADFTPEIFYELWFKYLKAYLKSFDDELRSRRILAPKEEELVVATKLHHVNVNGFYSHVGGAMNFISHSTCFCCLRNFAEHPLPCGHVLCTPCVKGYGVNNNPGPFVLASCPLHNCNPSNPVFAAPVNISFKPPLAGLRILSLDGGGMRGIVILEVLRHVQEELGGRIPIQDFFDLVVGTSTGGILALGLGVKNWTIEYCMKTFLKLVDKAFTPKFGGIGLGTTKYRTKPLEEALRDQFKDEALFGGAFESPNTSRRKVAVTSAMETAEQAVIFTNYNRAADEQIHYQLVRSDHPADDVMIWEAARATSAAPTFFKPFRNSRTMEGYLDGAVFHNNPIRIAVDESKLLWPDIRECPPDIVLSIGTAHHGVETDVILDATQPGTQRAGFGKMLDIVQPAVSKKRSMLGLRGRTQVESWLSIFKKRIEDSLDAELAWNEFHKDLPHAIADRYIRVNPKTQGRAPKMDDKAQVEALHEEIRTHLQMHSLHTEIVHIARRLVASSFYFDKPGQSKHAEDHMKVQGTLQCKFLAGSDNLRSLGRYISKHQQPKFQPYFRVQEAMRDETAQEIKITEPIIQDMAGRGLFRLDPILIRVASESSTVSIELCLASDRIAPRGRPGFPISGFPRTLADDDALKRTTTPALPVPEAEQRQARVPLERPASDSNVSYASHNLAAVEHSDSKAEFPETPDDISVWSRRRSEATRHPPVAPQLPYRVMQVLPQLGEHPPPAHDQRSYEVTNQSAVPPGGFGVTVPRTVTPTPNQWGDNYAPRNIIQDNDEEKAVEEALRRSEEDKIRSPRRTDTGTDPDELAEAIKASREVNYRQGRR